MAVLGEMMPWNEYGTVIRRGAVATTQKLSYEQGQVALLVLL